MSHSVSKPIAASQFVLVLLWNFSKISLGQKVDVKQILVIMAVRIVSSSTGGPCILGRFERLPCWAGGSSY